MDRSHPWAKSAERCPQSSAIVAVALSTPNNAPAHHVGRGFTTIASSDINCGLLPKKSQSAMILSTPPFFFCIFLLNSFNCNELTHVHPMRTRRLPLDISLKTRFWVSTRMSKTWLLVAGGQARICPRTALHACASAANNNGKTATLSHKLSCNTSAMFKPRKNERKDAKPSPYYSIIIAQCHVFFS